MAILKASKKALRKSEKRRIRNLKTKRKIKNLWKKFLVLIKEKSFVEARTQAILLQKEIDKAVKKGIFKKNKGGRLKSKVFHFLNILQKEEKS